MITTEMVKTWLTEYTENEDNLTNILDRIDDLESKITAPRIAQLDNMPHSNSSIDNLGEMIAKKDALEREAYTLLEESRKLYRDRESAISRITGKRWPQMRAVLRLHYLDFAPWHDVNRLLWRRKPDFEEHEDSYLRRTHRIHSEALQRLSLILDELHIIKNVSEYEVQENEHLQDQ